MENYALKKKRSADRCHLLARVPVYDETGNTLFYELKFTAGNVLKANALREKHIWHIIQGYFHRRSMVNFVGPGALAMITFPISPKIKEYLPYFPANKLIIKISKREAPTISSMHLVSHLNHQNVRFAIEVGLLLSTDWIKCIKAIEYVLIRQDSDFDEKLLLVAQLRMEAPWLKFVVTGVHNRDGFKKAFANGANYVKSSYFDFKTLEEYQKNGSLEGNLCQEYHSLSDFLRVVRYHEEDSALIHSKLKRYPTIVRDVIRLIVFHHKNVDFVKISSYKAACDYLGTDIIHSYLAIAIMRHLALCFTKATSTENFSLHLEPFKYALIHGKFFYLISKHLKTYDIDQEPFLDGIFANIDFFLAQKKEVLLENDLMVELMRAKLSNYSIASKIYTLITSIESLKFQRMLEATNALNIPSGAVVSCYEKAVVWSNELFEKIY